MRTYFIIISILLAYTLSAQQIGYISSKWDDSFREWALLDANESEIGFFKIKWDLANDFSEWTYELGNKQGDIKRKWRDDPNYWEIFSTSGLISARPIFRGDFRSWNISHQDKIYKLRHNSGYEWSIDRSPFRLATYYDQDPRDWIIEEIDQDMPVEVQMMAIFLSIYNSIRLE